MEQYHILHGRFFYGGLLEALVQGMGAAKGYLFHHGPTTAILAHSLSRHLGLKEEDQARLFFSSVLADVGMIGLVEEAWEDPVEVLPPDARAEVHRHPERSATAIQVIPYLDGVDTLIRHHHEWWDGSGYPDRLQGDEIPMGARILRLADTVTALGEDRPQRPPRSPSQIRELVEAGQGSEFDPGLARLWLDLERTGGLPSYHDGLYRELREQAIQSLVPSRVEASRTGVLLELFSSLIDAKDPYTGGHSRRVARIASLLADALGLEDEVQRHVKAAGYLHDLGKLSVPSRVLRKPSHLALDEVRAVRSHATRGAALLEGIPVLRKLAPACRHHHERWDGGGYPEGLSRDRIPLVARILGICDAYDAMTSARAYRPARDHEGAMEEIRAAVGSQFGPLEGEAFLALADELLQEVETVGRSQQDPFSPRPPGQRRRRTRPRQARSG